MIILSVAALVMIVAACCAASEISWAKKEKTIYPPGISRNPGLEILCTGLYDIPGGYCTYFTSGLPFAGFPQGGNITAVIVSK